MPRYLKRAIGFALTLVAAVVVPLALTVLPLVRFIGGGFAVCGDRPSSAIRSDVLRDLHGGRIDEDPRHRGQRARTRPAPRLCRDDTCVPERQTGGRTDLITQR